MKRIFNFQKGFTLVELVVVMAISLAVIVSVIIQHNKWNDRLVLSTQTYELVLAIRQAQYYSLAVREDTAGTGADKFNIGYGIYFDENDLVGPGGVMDRYAFFADRNNNKKYDSGEMIGGPIVLGRGVVIDRFCGATGSDSCNTSGGQLNQLNITFLRPELKAEIQLLNNGGNNGGTNPPATIYLRSPNGAISSVLVDESGQVSITQ